MNKKQNVEEEILERGAVEYNLDLKAALIEKKEQTAKSIKKQKKQMERD